MGDTASAPASVEEGFDDERFQTAVPQNLHCAICLNVLKQPMQCVRNEHSFCKPCIDRHLQQTQKCPICIEPLTIQTLRSSRLAADFVSELMINCDNAARGCLDRVKVEMLEAHVRNCEFSSVQCSNDGCEVIIDRKDQADHEINDCDHRQGKCEVCGKQVAYGKRQLHCYVTRTEIDEMKRDLKETKDEVSNIKGEVSDIKGEVSNIKGEVSNIKGEVSNIKGEVSNIKGEVSDIKGEVSNIKGEVSNIKGEVSDIKGEVSDIKGEVSDIKDIVTNLSRELTRHMGDVNRRMNNLERVVNENTKTLQSIKQEPQIDIRPSGSAARNSNFRSDVIIAGGPGVNSVEVFSWTTRQWTLLPAMTSERCVSSSFVHRGHMYVCGGLGSDNSMEVLQLGQDGARWRNFPVKLPHEIFGHTCVVYEDSLFIFGGFSDGKVTNDIYKILLVDPYSSQVVGHMPEPRAFHGAQCFGDKVGIVGGSTAGASSSYLNTVLVYDITNNCCQTLAPLPFAVCGMATVAWKDNIIILGGSDKNDNALNTVVKYNVTNEKSEMLPAMKHKRSGCSAVVTGNVIVAMGGFHGEVGRSVECFNFDLYKWEELPQMNEERCGATAVVKCV